VTEERVHQNTLQLVGSRKEIENMFQVINRRKSYLILSLLLSGLVGTATATSALDVGDKAPDFTLPSTTGEKMTLSQFRGKKMVLLEFYGADYSPV
jgi:hypothetical protein